MNLPNLYDGCRPKKLAVLLSHTGLIGDFTFVHHRAEKCEEVAGGGGWGGSTRKTKPSGGYGFSRQSASD